MLMDEINQGDDMVDGSSRQNSVTEVEDMAGPPLSLIKDRLGPTLQFGDRSAERHGIEIALDSHLRPEPVPGVVERNTPIQSDDLPACVSLKFE